MGRTGGDKTRQRILETAEELFSKNGFSATSVSEITRKAMVNKAALYYHFENKNDLILSMFKKILDDFTDEAEPKIGHALKKGSTEGTKTAIREEIALLERRRDIFAVMLMESFKSQDEDMSLFHCIEAAMQKSSEFNNSTEYLVHEFFTGFIPLLAFVALKDKWCEYFKCSKDEVLEQFIDIFFESHVKTHSTHP
jgi:AcrR family transcriptional regulator